MQAGLASPATWGVTLSSARLNGITQRWADTATNDVERMRPVILFLHGFPESWFSYRHQLKAAHAAGYRGIAPDMRGYGGTSAPHDTESYNVFCLASDMLSLLQHLHVQQAALVGHDHGAGFGWRLAPLHPDVFVCYMALSVPYMGRNPTMNPLSLLRNIHGDERKPETDPDFFYILHHLLPSATEDYGRNTDGVFRLMYGASPEPDAQAPVTSKKLFVDGRAEPMWRRVPAPKALAPWISQEELDYYINEFNRVGWQGGLNWYRVMDLNWHCTGHLQDVKVKQPVLFLAGSSDIVVTNSGGEENVRKVLPTVCEHPPEIVIIPNAGHWIQQEKPVEVNEAMLAFVGRCLPAAAPTAGCEAFLR